MRRIIIYQKESGNVELLDDSDIDLEECYKELSKLFHMTNVSILKTSHSTFIGRPSQLTGIVVEDMETKEIIEDPPKFDIEDDNSVQPPKAEIHEDIITDID